MGLLSLWNTSFLGINTQAILPYDQPLHKLPAYLQQAEMESNGKSVSWDGQRLSYTTGPIIWGSSGIDGQHAFYQFLHQSNTLVATDFIGSVQPIYQDDKHHHNLLANLFAQSQALMNGINEQQIANELSQKGFSDDEINRLIPHKVHQGSRPSSTLLLDKITPTNIGKLVALYEHKLFVQGILLQICSFDQWGVELGKVLAANIEPELAQEMDLSHHDGSTQGLIHYFKKHQ